jgi:hypothetical protein
MNTVSLEQYGPIISDKQVGDEILSFLKREIERDSPVVVDLGGIKSMATFCSKQIFGHLYLALGPQDFFEKLKLTNVTDDIKLIIRIGIEDALEDKNR